MTKQPLLCIIAAALAIPAAFAQAPRLSIPGSPDPLNPSDPLNSGVLPSKGALDAPGSPDAAAADTKKDKGPTEITSGEATFDQKAHIAIFMIDVVVKDPEFNVICDKLTAYLKHDDAEKPAVKGAKATPKPATPKAKPGDPDPPKKSSGGLERATAEMNAGGRVEITQDKKETDGTITHAVGHGTKADYNAKTGDIVLVGRPDVKKGTDWVIATEDWTVITLNRDGHMSTKGPTKTVIIDKGDTGLK